MTISGTLSSGGAISGTLSDAGSISGTLYDGGSIGGTLTAYSLWGKAICGQCRSDEVECSGAIRFDGIYISGRLTA